PRRSRLTKGNPFFLFVSELATLFLKHLTAMGNWMWGLEPVVRGGAWPGKRSFTDFLSRAVEPRYRLLVPIPGSQLKKGVFAYFCRLGQK
ncbi:hypothetical protein MRX56_14240, partial [Pseudodesulfovibrio sp. S3-i]|uniref:hypothetical protein n=1 Tax=Pseudodesulfovibrio sp. S3-i TaxID=2929474 RepID=UPI001FB8EBEF